MGEVITFKKPLSLPQSAPPNAVSLAEAFYEQCRFAATAQAMNAHKANPALRVGKLAGALTQRFAEDVIAQKMLESTLEGNPEKRAVAQAMVDIMTAKKPHFMPKVA